MIQSPVFIIGCPRSGTTLLYNILSEVPSLWSTGYESKDIIERYHHPRVKGWESGGLDAGDLTPASRAYMREAWERESAPGTFWRRVNRFRARLRSQPAWRWVKQRGRSTDMAAGVSSALPQQGLDAIRSLVRTHNAILSTDRKKIIRLLEKTPENCLRLPFLQALFPDLSVIYLVRDGPGNVNSLMEGWKEPHLFPGYQVPEPLSIPGYTRERWAFSLIPGWRELTASSLEEICAWQWIRCNEAVLAHQAENQGRVPYLTVRYRYLIASPSDTLQRIASFLQVDFQSSLGHYADRLPQINVTSAPGQAKWKRQNPEAVERILPLIEPMRERLSTYLAG